MTDTAVSTANERPAMDAIFGKLWHDPGEVGRPRLVGAALGVGVLAAVVVPYRAPGLGTFLVLAGALTVVAAAGRRRRTSLRLGSGVLCLLLATTVLLRDALWIVALCVLAAGAVAALALCHGRSFLGIVASAVAVPLATLRGLPWLARSLTTVGGPVQMWPLLRTVLVSLALLVTFGALFASADALFARWVDLLLPDVSLDGLFVRLFVLGVVTVATLAGVYVALVPPSVERLTLARSRPVRRFEWAVPVGLVIGTFVVFLVAQLTALFGGHAYLRRTTGLTYADYVHQGFGQLTVATALTLAVIATAVRRASRHTATERAWLRILLGLLCALTLVVVASALYRMHVYEEAYGFTRLRVLGPFSKAGSGSCSSSCCWPGSGSAGDGCLAPLSSAVQGCCWRWRRSTPTATSPSATSRGTSRRVRSTGPTSAGSPPTPYRRSMCCRNRCAAARWGCATPTVGTGWSGTSVGSAPPPSSTSRRVRGTARPWMTGCEQRTAVAAQERPLLTSRRVAAPRSRRRTESCSAC